MQIVVPSISCHSTRKIFDCLVINTLPVCKSFKIAFFIVAYYLIKHYLRNSYNHAPLLLENILNSLPITPRQKAERETKRRHHKTPKETTLASHTQETEHEHHAKNNSLKICHNSLPTPSPTKKKLTIKKPPALLYGRALILIISANRLKLGRIV